MRRYILAAVILVVAVGLGITSWRLISSRHTTAAKAGGAAARPSATDDIGRVAALLQVGIQQGRQQQWSAAAITFQDVLAISPKNVYAFYDLGVVDQMQNDNADAMNYYDQAIAANAKYAPALYNKAILLESSHPHEALGLYNRIIAINPQASTAYLRLAFVDERLNDMVSARAAYKKAIAIDPSLGKYSLPASK